LEEAVQIDKHFEISNGFGEKPLGLVHADKGLDKTLGF
jgi:hypothetical protein